MTTQAVSVSDDVEYHTKMLTSIKGSSIPRCKPILPFPREMTVTPFHEPVKEQKTYRFKTNYNEKLKEARCSSVYGRLNMMAMKESVTSGREILPRRLIAPMKTPITMFTKTNGFTMSQTEFDSIQTLTVHLPMYFNWMDNIQITRPYNQGLCGSCWAIAAATCLSDVFVVSKKSPVNPQLSPTYLLSCLPQLQCDGGDPSLAVSDMTTKGIGASSCLDYNWCSSTGCGGDPLKHFDSGNVNQYVPSCSCSVAPKDTTTKYFATDSMAICIPPDLSTFTEKEQSQINEYLGSLYGNVSPTNVDLRKYSVETIQSLIKYYLYTYGPLLAGFHIFSNFMKGDFNETNGIYIENYTYDGVPGIDYNDVEGSWVGSHAVVIVGWGQDTIQGETVPYWVVRNSWGTSWGKEGLWRMAMYGNDPTKKYQNRISQFEYPSIVTVSNGIALTGGIIIMRAGNIEQYGTVGGQVTLGKNNIVPDSSTKSTDGSGNPLIPVIIPLSDPSIESDNPLIPLSNTHHQHMDHNPYLNESPNYYYQHSPECVNNNSMLWVYVLLIITLVLLLYFICK